MAYVKVAKRKPRSVPHDEDSPCQPNCAIPEMIELAQEGYSLKAIGEFVYLSKQRVAVILNKHGVKTRFERGWNGKYKPVPRDWFEQKRKAGTEE